MTEYYDVVKASSEWAVSLESGEILVHESVTVDENIEGGYVNRSSETYVRFSGENASDFELKSTSSVDGAESVTYELIKDGDRILALENGEGDFVDGAEVPDIFENLRVEFEATNIKDASVEIGLKGVKSYKLTMNKEYTDSFDSETDGVLYDCTGLIYTYYVNPHGELEKAVYETTASITCGDMVQNVVTVVDATVA